MRLSKVFFIGLLLSAASPGAAATAMISGRVVVGEGGGPLPGANVILAGTPFHATTDEAGSFLFSGMAPGPYRVYVSHVGFASSEQETETGGIGAQELLFSLVPAPGRLDPVVVTASRAPATVLRSPVTAHVLDVGSGPAGPQTASDLLRALPGIDLSGGGAPGQVSGLSLRGAAPGQTLVLLDGVRLNMAGATSTLGGVDLSQIPVDRLDRVEVIKGPGSALYGADAAGGVVQLFSRGTGGPRTRVSLTAGAGPRVDDGGAYATQRYHASRGGMAGGWGWRADGSMGASGGHLENTDARTWNLAGQGVRQRSDGSTTLRAELGLRRGGAPGAEGQGQFGAFDIDDRQNDDVLRFSIGDSRPLRPGIQFDGSASGQWQRVERLNPVVQAGELVGDFVSRHQLWVLEPRVHVTGRHLRPFSFGAEYRLERQRDDLFGTESASMRALYAQNRLEIGAHVLEAGARLDNHSLYGTELNPRLAAVFRLRPGILLRAAAGRAFSAPSFDDLFKPTERFARAVGGFVGETGNRGLAPETVWSADAGLRWQSERAQGEATLYRSWYRDLIQPAAVRLPDGGDDLFLSLDNLAEAEIAGLELAQRLRAGRSQIQLAWTLQRASGRDADGDSRDLAGRLRRKLGCDYSLQLGGTPESGISFRADWQERFFDEDLLEEGEAFGGDDDDEDEEGEEAGAIGAPGEAWRYLVLGAGARFRLKPGMALHFDVANLADARYQSVFGIPQPGLVATVGLRLDLE
ncbi:MAG: TonB-dependent receptor [Gemmatimonadetes bacterium]|nr:TonB-dependent receptor [Gemmatimonadota bacterium]